MSNELHELTDQMIRGELRRCATVFSKARRRNFFIKKTHASIFSLDDFESFLGSEDQNCNAYFKFVHKIVTSSSFNDVRLFLSFDLFPSARYHFE